MKKRQMSAEGRARISAAQKARWKRQKKSSNHRATISRSNRTGEAVTLERALERTGKKSGSQKRHADYKSLIERARFFESAIDAFIAGFVEGFDAGHK